MHPYINFKVYGNLIAEVGNNIKNYSNTAEVSYENKKTNKGLNNFQEAVK